MVFPLLLCLVLTAAGLAAQPQYFEARNSAMGGVGVASSRYLSAPLANPALLARFGESDDFGFILPIAGLRIADEDELIDGIEAFQDEVDRVQTRLDNLTVTPGDLTGLADSLEALGGRSMTGAAGGGFVFALANDGFPFAISVNTYLDAQVTMGIDPGDRGRIESAATSGDLEALLSQAIARGAAITEVGFSVAHEFELMGSKLALGITPKFQRVDTYNYSLNVNTFEDQDFNDSIYRNDDSGFNVDVGAAFSPIPQLTIGLMVRNLVEEQYDTVLTNGQMFTYNITPTATLGAAVTTDLFTLAVDFDVTELERFKFDDASRMLRVGAEFNFWSHAQLRAGFHYDTEDTVQDLFTAGIGISPFDTWHLDVAGMIQEGETYGVVLQSSFTF
jgi:hypothetical protein